MLGSGYWILGVENVGDDKAAKFEHPIFQYPIPNTNTYMILCDLASFVNVSPTSLLRLRAAGSLDRSDIWLARVGSGF